MEPVLFERARLTEVSFENAEFRRSADFTDCAFEEVALFRGARFMGETSFNRASFEQGAEFVNASFQGQSTFRFASFLEAADFREMIVAAEMDLADSTFARGLHLAEIHRTSPARIDLLRANSRHDSGCGLLLELANSDAQGIDFLAVRWHREHGRLMLRDEKLAREGSISYKIAASAYRQLVRNFEASREYELAEEADIGAMEMRRSDPERSMLLQWAQKWPKGVPACRLLGRWFSATNLYRIVSRYGTSYARALGVLVLLVFLLGCAYLLPSAHLMPPPQRPIRRPPSLLTLLNYDKFLLGLGHQALDEGRLLVTHGALHAVEVATFQKERRFKADSAFGGWLDALTAVLVPAQTAMLLFALRRRFRR